MRVPVLLCCLMLSFGSGLVLEKLNGSDSKSMRRFMLLLPLLNSQGGSIGSVVASRLSTAIMSKQQQSSSSSSSRQRVDSGNDGAFRTPSPINLQSKHRRWSSGRTICERLCFCGLKVCYYLAPHSLLHALPTLKQANLANNNNIDKLTSTSAFATSAASLPSPSMASKLVARSWATRSMYVQSSSDDLNNDDDDDRRISRSSSSVGIVPNNINEHLKQNGGDDDDDDDYDNDNDKATATMSMTASHSSSLVNRASSSSNNNNKSVAIDIERDRQQQSINDNSLDGQADTTALASTSTALWSLAHDCIVLCASSATVLCIVGLASFRYLFDR
jgi:hypothetical protein